MPARGNRIPIEKRFAGKFSVCEETGCWNWTAASAEGRYGVLWFADGKSQYAHRVSFEIHIGPIPEGMLVCHKCDNGLCVNPEHLFLGTTKDNYDDMVSKGRGPDQRGELNASAKLNSEQVRQIRSLKNTKRSQENVASEFGVSRGTVRNIWQDRSWQRRPIKRQPIDNVCGSLLSFGV